MIVVERETDGEVAVDAEEGAGDDVESVRRVDGARISDLLESLPARLVQVDKIVSKFELLQVSRASPMHLSAYACMLRMACGRARPHQCPRLRRRRLGADSMSSGEKVSSGAMSRMRRRGQTACCCGRGGQRPCMWRRGCCMCRR